MEVASRSGLRAVWGIKLQAFESIRKTLFGRTLLFIALVVISGAITLACVARYYAGVAAEKAYDQLLSGAAIQVAENLYAQGGVLALSPPLAAFSTLSDYDLVYYKVADSRGVVIAGYSDLAARSSAASAEHGPTFENGTYQNQRVRIATIARYMPNTTVPGWAIVRIAQTVHARQKLTDAMTLKVWMLILIMSILAIGASGLAIKRGLRPLAYIEQIIVQRDPSDLRPLAVRTPTEIDAIIGAINILMLRLSSRLGIMQRFIADAAHQIRTPLAGLDAQIELLSAELDPQRRSERIATLRSSCADVGRLTGQLLNHAMVIHRSEVVSLQPVELNGLAREVLGRTIPMAGDKDTSVSFQSDAPHVYISGDSVSLQEAISNVIHNALLHGRADEIRVTVTSGAGNVVLSVIDNGAGIAPKDWGRALEPFVRLDGLHSGSGLGLAIVSEVMRAHGGRVSFEFPSSGGFSVNLTFQEGLPVARAPVDSPPANSCQ